MQYKFSLQTNNDACFYEITENVRRAVRESGAVNGIAVVYCPHTTAGITINENADPDVLWDMCGELNAVFERHTHYTHAEGNSDAHVKSSLVGVSETLLIDCGKLLLGTWQGVYFCEFDGGHPRTYYVKILCGA